MGYFIELNMLTDDRVLINTSMISDICENSNGVCAVSLNSTKAIIVAQTYDEVKELISNYNQICR